MATALSSSQNDASSSPIDNLITKTAKLASDHATIDRTTHFRSICSTLVEEMPKILRLPTYQQQVQLIDELRATITTLDSTTAKEAQMKSTLFWALVKVDDEIERRKQQ